MNAPPLFAISAAAAILVVLAFRLLLRGRVAPAWISALWLIALVRMLVPVAPSSPLSVMSLASPASEWIASSAAEPEEKWRLDEIGDAAAATKAGKSAAPVPSSKLAAPAITEHTPGNPSVTGGGSVSPATTTAPPVLEQAIEDGLAAPVIAAAPTRSASTGGAVFFTIWIAGALAVDLQIARPEFKPVPIDADKPSLVLDERHDHAVKIQTYQKSIPSGLPVLIGAIHPQSGAPENTSILILAKATPINQ